MKERGIGSQNSQPELIPIQSGLTQEALNPTLGGGDIFMAEPGQGEQPPRDPQERAPRTSRSGEAGRVEEASRRLARVRVEREIESAGMGPNNLPLNWDSWEVGL